MADKPRNKKVFKPSRPRVELTESILPELRDLEVGDTATITIKVKMISKSQGDRWGGIDCEDDDCEDSYLVREYGKEYAQAKAKDQAQMRGSFKILEADEDGKPNTATTGNSKADKFNAAIKAGKTPAQARALAGM